jgi:hypothetical protein
MSTNVCGTGGWSGPKPGDPDNNVALSAAPVFGGIQVFWTYPATNPYAVAHTLLYRGSTSNFQSAIQIGVVSGNRFFDQIYSESSITYYYWIQLVSVNGTVGVTVGPAAATYQPTISQIIEDLSAQIDEGLLAQTLRTKIDQITLNYQAIQTEITDRLADNAAYSALMAQLQGDVDGAVTLILNEITQRTDGDNALVTQINAIGVANQNNAALISTETSARVSADEALATQINTVAAISNGNTALIATESTTRANADEALATQINAVLASTNSNAAAITAESTARVTADSANASQITQLSSTVTLNHTTAMDAASTAQTAATNAQSSANTANALLTDLSADDKLTPTEKQQVRKEWDAVVSEKAGINSQASNYAITTENTLYNDSYALLDRYLLGTTAITSGNVAGTVSAGSASLTSLTTTTNLDKTYTPAGGSATASGAGFRLIWADFYKNRQALLNAIHGKAKALADTAQSAANTAQGTANTAVTNAATAQSTANTASTNASSALNQLTDISADDKWTAVEKQQIKLEWDGIVAEKSGINTQGTNYGLTTQNTAYNNAYSLLNQYLNTTTTLTLAGSTVSAGSNLLSSLTTTTALDKTYTPSGSSALSAGAGARRVFSDFYAARQALLNAIYAQAKALADAAQAKANSVESSLLTNYYTKAEFNGAVSNATITAQTGYGSSLSSVSQTIQAHINATGGRVQEIGARYTVQVQANGTVGGFGIYNTGASVEAGFDVTKFWIGQSSSNKNYPFIVTNGVVYMNNAMITNLGADRINTNGLIVRDTAGNPILGSGSALASGYIGAGTGTNLLADGSFKGGNIDASIGYYTTSGAPVLAHNLSSDYTLQGEGTLYLYKSGFVSSGAVFDANFTLLGAVPCTAGERFECSALLNPHRCSGVVICLFLNSSGSQVGAVLGNTVGQIGATTRQLANFTASRVIATAPAGATQTYLIVRANGIGQNDPYLFVSRAYFGRATISQTEYSPWSNGGGIKRITSGTASTYIADLAVNTLQIAGQAITVPRAAQGGFSSDFGPAIVNMPITSGFPVIITASFLTGGYGGLRRIYLNDGLWSEWQTGQVQNGMTQYYDNNAKQFFFAPVYTYASSTLQFIYDATYTGNLKIQLGGQNPPYGTVTALQAKK